MDPAHAAFERLRADDAGLRTIAARHGLGLVVVFGSVLRDGPASDIDVAVLPNGRFDPIWLLADLEQAFGPADFDLVDVRRSPPLLRREVMLGLPVFEARPGLFAEQQIAALTEFMETQWLRDLDRELLKG